MNNCTEIKAKISTKKKDAMGNIPTQLEDKWNRPSFKVPFTDNKIVISEISKKFQSIYNQKYLGLY
jgi:hypothetical protein